MNKICFVNGSPRGNKSASKSFIGKIGGMLRKEVTEIHEICVVDSQRNNTMEKDFALLGEVNSIVFVFPLYVDAIPSSLLEYMYEFDEYIKSHPHTPDYNPPRIYAVINNGFIEGNQNINALRIMKNYAARIGCPFGLGMGIGAGEFLRETMEVIPLKSRIKRNIYNALIKLTAELESEKPSQQENIMTNPSMPKFLFMAAANRHWTSEAKKPRKALIKKVWTEA